MNMRTIPSMYTPHVQDPMETGAVNDQSRRTRIDQRQQAMQSLQRQHTPMPKNVARHGARRFNNYVQNQRSTPTIPPRDYAAYGNLSEPAVQATDFARQLANQVVDDNGQLNLAALDRMIQHLEERERQAGPLPPSQRHALSVLSKLRHDPLLQKTVNETCANAPPRGAAADIVRATLNLPPQHQYISQADVRRAMMTAMLAPLYQGKVGSCFATGPAKAVSTRYQATQLQQLLQNNKLSLPMKGRMLEVPLNKRFSRAQVQVPLKIYDGVCFGNASNPQAGQGFHLHETPGMQAALTSLGIPPHEQAQRVAMAIGQAGRPLGNNGWRQVTEQQIIETLAHTTSTPNGRAPHHRIASALAAHSGMEAPALQRAWEYTLASSSEIDDNGAHIQKISNSVLYGGPIQGRPDLKSMQAATAEVAQRMHQVGWDRKQVARFSQQLHKNIDATMRQYWCQQYDADIKQPGTSADGVSNRGGFGLFEKIPLNDCTQWRRIDPEEPAEFQAAMQRAIDHAMNLTIQQMRARGTDEQAVRNIAAGLKHHAQTPGFITHAAVSMNPELASAPTIDLQKCSNLPWKQARGSGFSVIANLGGKVHFTDYIKGPPNMQSANPVQNFLSGRRQKYKEDPTPVLDVFFTELKGMKKELRNKVDREKSNDFKLPINCSKKDGGHIMNLNARAFRGIWEERYKTREDFINGEIVEPAREHMNAQRNDGLYPLLCDLGGTVNMPQARIDQMFRQMAPPPPGGVYSQQPHYSLGNVYAHFHAYTGGNPRVLGAIGNRLEQLVPQRLEPMIDMNWINPQNGQPTTIGFSYNPYTRALSAHLMDESGGNRRPFGNEWLTGAWSVSTPLW